jgi:hypothetical protein
VAMQCPIGFQHAGFQLDALSMHTHFTVGNSALTCAKIRLKPEFRGQLLRNSGSVKWPTWRFEDCFLHCRDTRWRSGWGTALQIWKSRVRFPTMSLAFFIDVILPAALWQKWVAECHIIS